MNESVAAWGYWGKLLIIVGVLTVGGGMFLWDPTIEVSTGSYSSQTERVANIQGLAIQLMIVMVGITLSIAGLICTATSGVIRALRANIAVLSVEKDVEDSS